MLSGTTTDYTYDADGEPHRGDRRRHRDAWTPPTTAPHELTNYDNSAANMTVASYDGDGLRTSATTTPSGGSSATQNFVWDTTARFPSC